MPPFLFHSLYTKLALTNTSFAYPSSSSFSPPISTSSTPPTSPSPSSPSSTHANSNSNSNLNSNTNTKTMTPTLSPHLVFPLPYVPYRPSFPPHPHPHPSASPSPLSAVSATVLAFRTGSIQTTSIHDNDNINTAERPSSVAPAPSPAILGGLSAYMRGAGAGTTAGSTIGTGTGTAVAAAAAPNVGVGVGVRAVPTPPLVSRPAVGLGVFSGGSGLTGASARGGGGRTQPQHQVRPSSRPHPRPEREQQEFERDYEREYARPVGGVDDGYGDGHGYGYGQQHAPGQSQSQSTRGGRDHEDPPAHSRAQGSRRGGESDERGYGHDEPLSDERYGYGYGYNNYGDGYGDSYSYRHPQAHPPAYGYGTGEGYDRRGGRREEGYGYGYSAAGAGPTRPERGMDDRTREQQLKEKEDRERERESKQRERERKARANCVLWAKWDLVDDRRILTLAYPSSLQIWDTSDLKSVKEVLNVHFDSEEWRKVLGAGRSLALGVIPNQDQDRGRGKGRGVRGEEKRGEGRGEGFLDVRVVDAKVLPFPPSARRRRSGVGIGGGGAKDRDRDRDQDRDQFDDVRPLLGILLETTEERYPISAADDEYGSPGGGRPTGWEMDMETERKTFLVLYSLLTHQVVVAKSLVFNTTADGVDGGSGRAEMMAVSGDVIVLSTSNPPTLHVLSASTLEVLYAVPSSALEAFAHPSPYPSPSPGTGLASNLIALSPSTSSSSGLPPTSPVPSSHGKSTSASGISLSIANAITNTLSSAAGLTLSKSGGQAERMAGYGSQDPEQQQSFFSSTYAYESYPRPVFALSGRLLAYASTSPAVAGSSSSAGSSPVSLSVDQSSPTPSSLMSNLSNLSRGMGSRIGIGATKMGRPSSSSGASASGLSPGGNGGSSSVSSSSSPFGGGGGGGNNAGLGKITGMTQAEVGQAALKVGESVFSGMKFLGGMAYEAAKSRVGGGGSGTGSSGGSRERDRERDRGGRNVPVSRSVPDTPDADEVAARVLRERRYSSNMSNISPVSASSLPSSSSPNSVGNVAATTTTVVTPHTKTLAEHGHYVTVIDLAPLFNANHMNNKLTPAPRKIDEFNASRSQPVAGLRFSQDGTSVSVLTRDGHSVKVFKLFPASSVATSLQSAAATTSFISSSTSQMIGGVDDDQETEAALDRLRAHRRALQTYDLYRGRTSAVVEDVAWARDGRWAALGTRNRTVHVFATNPYGGKSDLRSHMEGRVRGVDVIEYPLTALTALAKLRGSKSGALAQGQAQGHVAAPLAFTFISPTDVLSSPDLVPPLSPNPSSSHSSSNSHPSSSPKITHMGTDARRSKNFQDILLFDPATGVLSLRRLTLDKHPVREGVVAALGAGVSATRARASVSMSLPGSGGGGAGAGRLSSSPRMGAGVVGPVVSAGPGPGGMRGEEQKQQARQEVQMELGAKESVMATWDLRRASDRAEVRVPVRGHVHSFKSGGAGPRGGKRDALSQGELTTSSPSPLVLPRSLYLSHQFAFYTLGEGEDYHALIRRYQFDGVAILGRRIEVRRGVEVSVGGVGSPQKTASGGNTGILIPGGRSLGSAGDDAFVEEFPSSPQSHPHPHHSRSLSHSHALSHSLSHRHSIQQVSSSFDEPIASAISGTFFDFDDPNANTLLHPSHPHSPPNMNLNLPPILPMYPNGVPGLTGGGPPSKQKAVAAASMIRNAISNAIPIRGMGMKGVDGVRSRYKAGLGSNTRIGHVMKDREEAEGEGVSLEFDEEDEDFVGGADTSVEASTATIVPLAPPNRQHQALNPDLGFGNLEGGDVVGSVDEEIWNEEIEGEGGWDTQDREAIEEQEGFWDFVGGGKSGVGEVTATAAMTGIGHGGSKLLAAGSGAGGVDGQSGPIVKDGGSGTVSTSASTAKGTNPKRSGNSKQKQSQRRV